MKPYEPDPQDRKGSIQEYIFIYKNSVIQSVAFKINYTYTIIKMFVFLNKMFWNPTVWEQAQCSKGIQIHHRHLNLVLLLGSVPRCPGPTQGSQCLHHWLLHTLTGNFTIRITKDGVQESFVCLPCLIQGKANTMKKPEKTFFEHLTDGAMCMGPNTRLGLWLLLLLF